MCAEAKHSQIKKTPSGESGPSKRTPSHDPGTVNPDPVGAYYMKSPAILFYTSDFLTGTMTMTDDQVGKYIRLLCLQHQKGVLSEKDMMYICKSYDEEVFSKFVKNGAGYYNERMKIEMERRENYSKSRAENRIKGIENKENKKKKHISKSYDNHMENENENINKGVQGENKIPNGWESDIPLYKGLLLNYPKLFKMKSPLTFDQHNKIVAKFTTEKVKPIYEAMQNKADLLKKYDSAFLTANNWLNRDVKK